MLSRYLVGAASARTGDEMSGTALLLLGLSVAGSPVAASMLLAGLTISSAVGGPLFGTLLDRTRTPGRVLAVALAAYALGLTTVLTTLGHLPLPAVVALAVLTGLFNPAIAGGWTSQLPRIADDLDRATALDALTFSAASLVGPALAALVAEWAGASTATATAIGLVVLALPSAWSLPGHTPTAPRRTKLVVSRALWRVTATSTVSYVAVGMSVISYPLLGERNLGSPARGALLLAVLAAASLTANALLSRHPLRRRPDEVVFASTVVLAASLALCLLPGPWVVLAAVVAGLGEGPQLTALFAVRHREAPEHLRARVFTTGASLKIAGFAVGSALSGPLAANSLTGCLLAAAAVQSLAAMAYLAFGD